MVVRFPRNARLSASGRHFQFAGATRQTLDAELQSLVTAHDRGSAVASWTAACTSFSTGSAIWVKAVVGVADSSGSMCTSDRNRRSALESKAKSFLRDQAGHDEDLCVVAEIRFAIRSIFCRIESAVATHWNGEASAL